METRMEDRRFKGLMVFAILAGIAIAGATLFESRQAHAGVAEGAIHAQGIITFTDAQGMEHAIEPNPVHSSLLAED